MRNLAFRKIGVFAIIAILVSACNTRRYGTDFQQVDVDSIKVGITTEKEIVGRLGKPQSFTEDHNKVRTLVWMHNQSSSHGKQWIPIVGPSLAYKESLTNFQLRTLRVTVKDGIIIDAKTTEQGGGSSYQTPN